jgi:hypothetical protein
MIHDRSCREFDAAVQSLPQFEDAAGHRPPLTGWPTVIKLFARVALMCRLNDSFAPSLAAEALRVAQGHNQSGVAL